MSDHDALVERVAEAILQELWPESRWETYGMDGDEEAHPDDRERFRGLARAAVDAVRGAGLEARRYETETVLGQTGIIVNVVEANTMRQVRGNLTPGEAQLLVDVLNDELAGEGDDAE